jgi:hypothetical protein
MSDLNREYKSTIFTMLFSDKEKLKSLCEAVSGEKIGSAEDIIINTLKDEDGDRSGIFTKLRNDVSFIFQGFLNMYEHQSTWTENMPVRMLFYYADLLRADHPVRELYQNPAIDLDTPRFVVFYNGDDKANDFDRKELRLSEHFVRKSENPDAEIRVMVYNVNEGHNRELMDACNTLKEYSTFVALSKKALKGIRDQREKVQAMKRVLDECLERDILVDFIQAHREVIVMRSIWEYDEQAHYEALREDGYDAGKKDGLREGKDTVFQILDRLKSGKSAESLIAEGMDPEIVQMASKYL